MSLSGSLAGIFGTATFASMAFYLPTRLERKTRLAPIDRGMVGGFSALFLGCAAALAGACVGDIAENAGVLRKPVTMEECLEQGKKLNVPAEFKATIAGTSCSITSTPK